jgi:hypothetical protein
MGGVGEPSPGLDGEGPLDRRALGRPVVQGDTAARRRWGAFPLLGPRRCGGYHRSTRIVSGQLGRLVRFLGGSTCGPLQLSQRDFVRRAAARATGVIVRSALGPNRLHRGGDLRRTEGEAVPAAVTAQLHHGLRQGAVVWRSPFTAAHSTTKRRCAVPTRSGPGRAGPIVLCLTIGGPGDYNRHWPAFPAWGRLWFACSPATSPEEAKTHAT